jgi:hypothetical protein
MAHLAGDKERQRPQYVSASGIGHLGKAYRLCGTLLSGFLGTILLLAFLVAFAAWLTDFFIRDGWIAVIRTFALPVAAGFVVILIFVYCVLYLHVRIIGALAALIGAAYCINAPWTLLQLYRLRFHELGSEDINTFVGAVLVTVLLLTGIPLWLTFISFGLRTAVAPTRWLRAVRLPPPDPRSIGGIVVHALGVPPAIRKLHGAGIVAQPALSRIVFGFVALSVFSTIIYIPNNYFTYIVAPCVTESARAENRLLDDAVEHHDDESHMSAFLEFDRVAYIRRCFDDSRAERERISGLLIRTAASALILAIVLMPVSWALYRSYRRQMVRSLEEATASDVRRPVLYLRSFDLDRAQFEDALTPGIGSLLSPADTPRDFDELLKLYGEVVGPVVGLGSPDDRTQRFGVSRAYPTDDEWRNVVAKEADRAAMIVMVMARSQGVEWEVRHLTEKGHWTKTLCYFGTDYGWDDVAAFIQTQFGHDIKKRSRLPIAFAINGNGKVTLYDGSDRQFATLHAVLVDHINNTFGRERWLVFDKGDA